MSTYRNAEPRSDDLNIERLRRKRDQEWDMSGLARVDGDKKDEERHRLKALDYERQLREYGA